MVRTAKMFTVLRINIKSYHVIFGFIPEDKNKDIETGNGNLEQKIHIWKIVHSIYRSSAQLVTSKGMMARRDKE